MRTHKNKNMHKLLVISLGGSLIVPEEIDIKFLKGFKRLIEAQTKKGSRFIIITGGGKICRKYQTALSQLANPSKTDLDWMGIQATWLNAKFIQLMFGKLAHLRLISDPNKRVLPKAKILVAGGWVPGRSTDDDAVRMATTYGAKTVINLSNIDYLYTKDPRKFTDAKKIKEISWDGLLKITGRKWVPGKNVPFDPVAAKFAKKNMLKVIIANGKDLNNLKNIFQNRKFKGSVIM